jgi:hypothetical protein
MPRKWPVTFGKGPEDLGRAYDTTRMVPGRSEHQLVPRWRPTSSQTRLALFSLFGSWAAERLNQFFHCLAVLAQPNPLG